MSQQIRAFEAGLGTTLFEQTRALGCAHRGDAARVSVATLGPRSHAGCRSMFSLLGRLYRGIGGVKHVAVVAVDFGPVQHQIPDLGPLHLAPGCLEFEATSKPECLHDAFCPVDGAELGCFRRRLVKLGKLAAFDDVAVDLAGFVAEYGSVAAE